MSRSQCNRAEHVHPDSVSEVSGTCGRTLRFLAPFIMGIALTWTASAVDLGDLSDYSARLSSWDTSGVKAGVQGGIPDTSDVTKWPLCTGGVCDLGPSPSPTEIQAAINQATKGCGGTEGCVVEVPAGTTTFGSGNGNPYIDMKSNVLLRGAGSEGPTSTHFNGNGPHKDSIANPQGLSGIATFSGTRRFSDLSVLDNSFPAGKDTFTFSDASGIQAGNVVTIIMNTVDYSWLENPGGYSNLGGPKFTGRVESVVGNRVTLDRAILWDLTPNSPSSVEADVYDPLENAGIENIHFDWNGNSGKDSFGHGHIAFLSAINCWLRGNFIEHGNLNQVTQDVPAMNISIVGNKIGITQHFILKPTTNADSYPVTHRSYGLTANNIFTGSNIQGFFAKYETNANVYAHNFARSSSNPNSRFGHGIIFHGRGTHNNLIEGNYSTDNIIRYGEHFWGRQGPHNTFYRNRVRELSVEDVGITGMIAESPNLIGNISYRIWQSLFCGVDEVKYESNMCGAAQDVDVLVSDGLYIYNIATDDTPLSPGRGLIMISPQASSDCGTGAGNCGTGDAPHGENIEGGDRGAKWASLDLPPSLFFESRYDWELRTGATWCVEACDFNDVYKGIGAFGDRDASNNGSFAGACMLPAQIRDEGGACTPLDGTAAAPAPPILLE